MGMSLVFPLCWSGTASHPKAEPGVHVPVLREPGTHQEALEAEGWAVKHVSHTHVKWAAPWVLLLLNNTV